MYGWAQDRQVTHELRRCASRLDQAEKAELRARLKLETDAGWDGTQERKVVVFWQTEIERLRQALRNLLLGMDEPGVP